MEIEKQIFTIFGSFIRDLSKTYPEIKNCLYRNYEDCLVNEDRNLNEFPKLKKFLDKVHENEKLITRKDVSLFDTDVDFLEEISFSKLWSKNISDKTRDTIWKYFQTFTIITINLKSSEQLQEALQTIDLKREDIKDKQTAKDLKKLKGLIQEVQKDIPNDDDENGLDDMLGGLMNSNIGAIAKEVAESMDVENMFGSMDPNANPMEVMAQMMQPDKMGSIFQNINSVMSQKMESGELTEESLKSEAEGMYGSMADNPMFSGLMQQMKPNEQSKKETTEETTGETTGETNEESKEESKEETTEESKEETKRKFKEEKKKKLKKKIDEKKRDRLNQ